MESVDNLPKGSLDGLHLHRLKNVTFTLYCPKCIRAFDYAAWQDSCSRCGTALQDITERNPTATAHRYYCDACRRQFDTFRTISRCLECGSNVTQLFKLSQLGFFDRLFIRFSRRFAAEKKQETKRNVTFAFPSLTKETEELPAA